MSNKFYTMTVFAYCLLEQLKDQVRKMERGDADSSGSTLRTFGVVAIVLAVVIGIGTILFLIFPEITAAINHGRTTFNGWLTQGGAN
jgi:hypothetical protein